MDYALIDREMRERVLGVLSEGKTTRVVCKVQPSACSNSSAEPDVCRPSYSVLLDFVVTVNDALAGEVQAIAFCVDYTDSSVERGTTYGCIVCSDFADGRLRSLKDALRRGAVVNISQTHRAYRDMLGDGVSDAARIQRTVLRNARLVSEERSMAIDDILYERRLWFTADAPEETVVR